MKNLQDLFTQPKAITLKRPTIFKWFAGLNCHDFLSSRDELVVPTDSIFIERGQQINVLANDQGTIAAITHNGRVYWSEI